MDFVADSRIVAGGKITKNKFFYAGKKWRMEEEHPEGHRVVIFRQDKRSLYILWPDKKRYVIQPLPEKEFQIISTRKPGEEIERIQLGDETISGFTAAKCRVKYNTQGRVMTSIEWFSDQLGVIIRSEAEDKSYTSELINIKKGSFEDRLFDIPADYQKLSARDVLTLQKRTPQK